MSDNLDKLQHALKTIETDLQKEKDLDDDLDVPDEEDAAEIGSADDTQKALNKAEEKVDDFTDAFAKLKQIVEQELEAEHRSIEKIQRHRYITTNNIKKFLNDVIKALQNGANIPQDNWTTLKDKLVNWEDTALNNISAEAAESLEDVEAKKVAQGWAAGILGHSRRTTKDAKKDIEDAEKDLDDHYAELDEHLTKLQERVDNNGFSLSALPDLRQYIEKATKVEKDYHELYESVEEAEAVEKAEVDDVLNDLKSFIPYVKNEEHFDAEVQEEFKAVKHLVGEIRRQIAEERKDMHGFIDNQVEEIEDVQQIRKTIQKSVNQAKQPNAEQT